MANKNDFKPFAIGAGANVTPQADWEALAALDAGFQSGKASSAQVNKALRQGTFVASALAQFISNKLAADVIDDGDLSGFVTDFINAIKAQSLTRDNPFADIKADGTVNTALENLGLGTAAKKNVGTGTGQIPDMSNFTYAGASNVFTSIVIAGNRRIMEGSGSGNFVNGVLSFTLPLAYPSTGFTFIPTDVGSGVVSYAAIPESGSVVTIYGKDAAGANLNGSFSFKYMAMGSA
ncbi:hypothetical protein [Escherichia coli]|uniref:hypothetical protein n=1 Tax=Escherichia coli TaxID=562 RepID=UPI001E611947|nr:hypothetical protein [Escherichia coli]MCD9327913.1 hypothetical protein [Escherichia coli]MCX9794350.1 hypothetical protein [Escherichia coli]